MYHKSKQNKRKTPKLFPFRLNCRKRKNNNAQGEMFKATFDECMDSIERQFLQQVFDYDRLRNFDEKISYDALGTE